MPRIKSLRNRHVVYLLFDVNDELLYVGVTSCQMHRIFQHQRSQPWFPFVESCKFEHCDTREEAEDLEVAYIRVHQPKYNKHHKNEWPTSWDLALV